jgi:hypothetical protein
MDVPVSFTPHCHFCNKPVSLESAKADAQGRTVHSGCYLLALKSVSMPDAPADPA